MPSWILNEGLRGHTSGPDLDFVGPEERTADRVVVHQGDDGTAPRESSYTAIYDEERLLRATRRQAKLLPPKRFPRAAPRPAVEEKVIEHRKEAQEDEWRRMMRRQRGQPSSVVTSCAPTQASKLTAGLHSKETQARTHDKKCATYGRMCMAICPGDILPAGPPLPFGSGSKSGAASQVVSESQVPTGLDKLGRLLQLGSRP